MVFLDSKIFENICYFQVSVSSTLKVIKATFDFSQVSKYSVGKMSIHKERQKALFAITWCWSHSMVQNWHIKVIYLFRGALCSMWVLKIILFNATARFKKCKQLFEYQHLLFLRDSWWSKFKSIFKCLWFFQHRC